MNMRKIIAVLSAVLMLCAIIPMGAVSVYAANLLSNGTFDSNTNGWGKTGSTVMVAEDGALKATHADDWAYVYTWLNVEADTDYTLSFRAKASAGGFKVNFNNSSWGSAGIASQTPSITTDWKEYELDFNTGSYGGQLLVFFNSTLPGSYAQTIWLDDVIIAPKAATLFEGDNLFVNGDFETGNTNGWNKHQQTTVTAGAAKDGSYGAYLNGNSASWGGVLDQTVNVIPGKQYVFSFDSKAVVQGLNWSLTGVQSGTKYAGSYAKHTEWNHFELKFRPEGDTQLKLNFNCGGGSGTDEMYVDNVSLLKVREMSNDGYLKNGTFDLGNYDNWTNLWNSTTLEIVEGGYNSDYALKGTTSGAWNITYQEIAVEANTDYIISAWAKDSANAALWIKGAGGNGDMGSANFSSGDWAKATVEVNSGANTSLWVGLMGLEAGATYTVDNVLVLKKIPASDDGYIYNGNFESGKKESFNFDQQTAVSMDAAKDGNFGAELKGNGGWGGMLGYTFAVEAGATYELSFDARALSNGANVTILADTWQGAKLKTGWIGGNEWKTYTLEFVATTNQCYLNINGAGNGTAEHIYFDNLGVVKTKDAHVCSHVETARQDATCGADGYVTYTCSCGDSYTETLPATGEHVYFDDCSAICEVCGYEREVSHNIVHVEAKAPTCTAIGNIEYWYCDVCGMAWLDEACTMNTNLRAVNLPATGEHTYDNDFDVDCNVCGDIRKVDTPVVKTLTSASEDVSGVAALFDINVEGLAIKDGTKTEADFTNAKVNGYKLTAMGAIASNGKSSVDIPVVYMYQMDEEGTTFAIRVKNIPAANYDDVITFVPYFVFEIDGEQVTLTGDAVTASYNGILG